ncbi:hypothetical protein SKAU_G00374650 [Synaphobranchus kaupii]|uniref:Uncharacterized protein n=1 Tax=Synaphobranchus kaupii TaxID=118154 RepID=A0A9Q1EGT4_SYNKA|nr:hypothetical protein SKAU_G00374650 [Synaphobranchus kaupii]
MRCRNCPPASLGAALLLNPPPPPLAPSHAAFPKYARRPAKPLSDPSLYFSRIQPLRKSRTLCHEQCSMLHEARWITSAAQQRAPICPTDTTLDPGFGLPCQ